MTERNIIKIIANEIYVEIYIKKNQDGPRRYFLTNELSLGASDDEITLDIIQKIIATMKVDDLAFRLREVQGYEPLKTIFENEFRKRLNKRRISKGQTPKQLGMKNASDTLFNKGR